MKQCMQTNSYMATVPLTVCYDALNVPWTVPNVPYMFRECSLNIAQDTTNSPLYCSAETEKLTPISHLPAGPSRVSISDRIKTLQALGMFCISPDLSPRTLGNL